MKLRCHASIGLVGCEREETIEIDDGLTDGEIEAAAREWKDEQIEWSFEVVRADAQSTDLDDAGSPAPKGVN